MGEPPAAAFCKTAGNGFAKHTPLRSVRLSTLVMCFKTAHFGKLSLPVCASRGHCPLVVLHQRALSASASHTHTAHTPVECLARLRHIWYYHSAGRLLAPSG